GRDRSGLRPGAVRELIEVVTRGYVAVHTGSVEAVCAVLRLPGRGGGRGSRLRGGVGSGRRRRDRGRLRNAAAQDRGGGQRRKETYHEVLTPGEPRKRDGAPLRARTHGCN